MLIKKETEYAILGLSTLAELGEDFFDIREVIQKTNLPYAHLAKIFQKLVKAKILESKIGPNGGFRLSRNAEQISFLEIINAVQNPNILKCTLGKAKYCQHPHCKIKQVIKEMEDYLNIFLEDKKLADLKSLKGTNGQRKDYQT